MGDASFQSGFTTGFGSAFFQFLFERLATLGSVAGKEIKQIWDVDEELRKLHRTFLQVHDLLNHVEGSPLIYSGGSKAWQFWFEDLRKLAYDSDALLDHISLHLSTFSPDQLSTQENQVRSMVTSSFQLHLPHEICSMQNKLENLAKEMESLLTIEKMKCGSRDIDKIKSLYSDHFCSTSSFIDQESVVGRLSDKEWVADLLKKEYQEGSFSVISVVGMGGIGKTTLARLVYDQDNSFQKKMWVDVSRDFNAIGIMKSIIESVTGQTCIFSDLNSVQVLLQQILRGFKFLLVLDDYWSENHDDWDVLSLSFRYCYEGSKVIVTTRSTKVSSIVSSFEPYHLQDLSDDDCWTLMKKRAFSRVKEQDDLQHIGKEIAKKCKGLPLAAKTLGSLLLHCKPTKDEWHSILESNLWELTQVKNDVFHALMLSYIHLPSHLQKCFAYCSLFPKNHKFEVEELILLWMAEGFIDQPINGRRWEDLGRDYFNDLYSRLFFQPATNVTNQTNQTKYQMHYLIHDMAQLVSRDVCLQVKYGTPLFGNTCHLSMICDSVQQISLNAYQGNKRLRTFLLINEGTTGGQVSNVLFTQLCFLRVLDLSSIGLSNLPDSVNHLKCLRYLNLSGNHIPKLPQSICELVALQTLKLKDCLFLRELPENTKNLSNLRHLELDIERQLNRMPLHFGKLTNLQGLSAFIVGKEEGNGIDELRNMNGLRGSLCIKNILSVLIPEDAVEAKLSMKLYLDRLELQWEVLGTQDPQQINNQTSVLENLQPHENLKELVIKNYPGASYPPWFEEPSRMFTSIDLVGLKHCNHLPPLGHLPFLKYFHISDMPLLVSIDARFYGPGNNVKFPLLESFQVCHMTELSEWIADANTNSMPCLKNFTIHACLILSSLPQFLYSATSKISHCPNLRPLP